MTSASGRFDLAPAALRRLLAAVLLQAAEEAQRGNRKEIAWLVRDGVLWADALDICHPEVVRAWVATLLPPGERIDAPAGGERKRLAITGGTGFEKLAALLAEDPGITVKEAATALNLTRQTVKNYRHLLKVRAVS